MITRQVKHVVVFALALGVVVATVPRGVAASSSSTIYSFGATEPIDGAVPKGSLTSVNGLLFGRTTTTIVTARPPPMTIGSYGVIFHFDPNNVASTYSIDHVFAGGDLDDGDNPRHDAMTPLNGLLYGTTLEGGTHNNGIIFSIGQDGTDYQVLLSLHNSIGDESHSCFVVGQNGILYGMTASGGDNGEGVIFSFNPATPTPTPTATPTAMPANFQTLFSFACASSTGKEPHGRLTLDPNLTILYGMTRKGGDHDLGVVFKFDTSDNTYSELHDFAGGHDDGATSDHGYVVQSGDHLYGITTNGGHHDDGVLFRIKTDGSSFDLLHKFGETHHDGKNPYGSLLLVDNKLYGTTANGGDNDLGTVFVINTDGNNYQRLYSFSGQTNNDDGSKPIDNVILVNGWLYGMTTEGGAKGQGTIFKVSPIPSRSPTPAPRPTPPH
ncbi:MAG TPA: choice-of-anchor tandem repeat GloVer-containing protein [Candidatus Udaeobacter sp.]|nr:choice-of-anchor tandem repeat GloVer-containing protein [Candidatus Udaeobacter sp.]